MAMIARRLGRSVVLIDKGSHPRVVIGESSTPLTNLLIEELATRYDLPAVRPLAKWGSWQNTYPDVGCGLKRGFTFYHHDLIRPEPIPSRASQLLVAASPNNRIADTHWYRADFDHLLVRQAEELGVDYFDQTRLETVTQSSNGLALDGSRHANRFSLSARFVIDASGPRGFLHHALRIPETKLPGYPATQALYSHFSGVGRLEDISFGANREQPPYPIDDAAVHHIFDGGWIWVLRFNNGITSAGVAATDQVASSLKFSEGAAAWRRLIQAIPPLEEQFATAQTERPFTHITRLSFRSQKISGDNWALLPSAAGFVDPLLSTGFPLALLGVTRLAEIIENHWDSDCFPDRLATYADHTQDELLATARLIAALYGSMNDFPVFSTVSLLYFAAASFSETVRRLGKPHLAKSFLLHDHPVFGAALRKLLGRAHLPRTTGDSDNLMGDIVRSIGPFNVAGLGDPSRNNWYPVDPEDLFRSAAKLEAHREEIAKLLERCGFELATSEHGPAYY